MNHRELTRPVQCHGDGESPYSVCSTTLAHRGQDSVPNSKLYPPHPVLWFLASIKALCCHEKSMVQPLVRAVGTLQQFWNDSSFSLLVACFFKFPTGVGCCDPCYPAPLNTIAVTSSWNKPIILFQASLGIKTPTESSPKEPHLCIYRSSTTGCDHSDSTGMDDLQDAVCIGSRTKRHQDPFAVPVLSVILATCFPNAGTGTGTGTAGLVPHSVPVFVAEYLLQTR